MNRQKIQAIEFLNFLLAVYWSFRKEKKNGWSQRKQNQNGSGSTSGQGKFNDADEKGLEYWKRMALESVSTSQGYTVSKTTFHDIPVNWNICLNRGLIESK